jgi:hypothetical protein
MVSASRTFTFAKEYTMATYLTGPLELGTGLDNTGADTGTVMQSQTTLINFDATLVQSATLTLPANAQIIEIFADTQVAYNSATSATLTVGTSAGATTYVTSVNTKTGGRNSTSHTAAQVTAMANIGTNTSVVATVTSVGQPTAGQVRVTVFYAQN